MGTLMIIKLSLSIVIVVGVAEISKRMSPLIGGIISGLPLGTGLTVYFISYEQGTEFAFKGIPWGIAGLSASIIFCLTYLIASRMKILRNRFLTIVYSAIMSMIVFLTFGYLIFLLKLNIIQATVIFLCIFCVNIFMMNKLVGTQKMSTKSGSSLLQVFWRSITVSIILLTITGIASLVGSKWAGILSSFPSTLFPLILVLHYEEGDDLFPHVIYGFSYSIITLLLFYYAYIYFIPKYGLNIGFLLIYGVCMVFLAFFRKIQTAIEKLMSVKKIV